ncbi:MAG: DUF4175 family protein [Deltaproteobacteria bacterium]|nr:DUF4175 family protein [Deltaproteobacteria bacterium]
MGQEEYSELSSFLARFIRRLRIIRGVEGLCLIAIGFVLLFSVGVAVREIKSVFPYAPLVYTVITTALVVLLTSWTLFLLCRRVSREWAARYVEKLHPELKNNLINSLQLYPQLADGKSVQSLSISMVLALLRATRKQLQTINVEDLVHTGRIGAELRLLGMLFIPVLAMVLFNPSSVRDTFSLLTNPLRDLPPSETFIDVIPKGIRVVRGSAVTVQATASGAIPKSMDLVFSQHKDSLPNKTPEEKIRMQPIGEGKFSATIQDLQASVEYSVKTGPFTSSRYMIETVDPPEIGNLTITLYPPHYTGLPAQVIQGGNVEGIKGSTLRLDALATKEVLKARLLLDGGKEVPLRVAGRKIQGNLVLFQSQKYRIVIEDPLAFRNSPITYELRVNPDGLPTVDLLKPVEDLEVNGDESLPLEFSARDDFGIQQIHLSFKVGDRQERLPIERDANKKMIVREQFKWDLGKLGLRQGDEAIYHLEVLDNDTVSGPKTGSSRPLRLRLKDLKGEHRHVSEMIQELSRQMLDLLADHLETPSAEKEKARSTGEDAERSFEQKADAMMQRIEEAMRRAEKDRLSDFATWSDLEALKRNLKYTKEELLQKKNQAATPEDKTTLHDEMSSELERMSLLSEEIGKRLKGQEVAATAQDLMKSQERLLDSLDRLKSGDKNLDAVLKEISELAKMLSSLQQSLSQFASRLPDDFVNSEALRGLGFNEMFSALEEIRKKLMQGDIEGAMQLARELFSQMASMVAALQGANRSAMSSMMGRMQGEMTRSSNELQQILREQQEILLETEAVQKKSLGERDDRLKQKLEEFQAKAQQELSRLAELFPDEERESSASSKDSLDDATVNNLVKNMISRLLNKDFTGLSEIMEMARKELQKKRTPEQENRAKKAEGSFRELKGQLEALLQEPSLALGEAEKKRLRDLSHRESVLKERAEELHEKLDSLFQLFPSLDPKITKNLQEAGTAMGKAQNRLADLDGKGAIPPEREALDLLSQSQQQMQNSMQQLAQRGQLGRMPVSRLFRMGRFLPSGQLVPLPGMPEFPQFEVEGGITGLDMERFQLPGKEDYKAPRSFREEIVEALKQGMPSQFKEQIESYFRNLSE